MIWIGFFFIASSDFGMGNQLWVKLSRKFMYLIVEILSVKVLSTSSYLHAVIGRRGNFTRTVACWVGGFSIMNLGRSELLCGEVATVITPSPIMEGRIQGGCMRTDYSLLKQSLLTEA